MLGLATEKHPAKVCDCSGMSLVPQTIPGRPCCQEGHTCDPLVTFCPCSPLCRQTAGPATLPLAYQRACVPAHTYTLHLVPDSSRYCFEKTTKRSAVDASCDEQSFRILVLMLPQGRRRQTQHHAAMLQAWTSMLCWRGQATGWPKGGDARLWWAHSTRSQRTTRSNGSRQSSRVLSSTRHTTSELSRAAAQSFVQHNCSTSQAL